MAATPKRAPGEGAAGGPRTARGDGAAARDESAAAGGGRSVRGEAVPVGSARTAAAPALLSGLLPPGVTVVERRAPGRPEELLDAERDALGRAAPRRLAEFAAGRACARAALAALGLPRAPLLRGADRQPLWPAGIAGAITHTAGYCAAAVARAVEIAALGIDAEPAAPLPPGVLELVARPEEIAALHDLDPAYERLLFSAKESMFKAWFPLTRRWLGFHDARLAFAGDGSFTATILVPSPVAVFAGRHALTGGLALTAIAVPAP